MIFTICTTCQCHSSSVHQCLDLDDANGEEWTQSQTLGGNNWRLQATAKMKRTKQLNGKLWWIESKYMHLLSYLLRYAMATLMHLFISVGQFWHHSERLLKIPSNAIQFNLISASHFLYLSLSLPSVFAVGEIWLKTNILWTRTLSVYPSSFSLKSQEPMESRFNEFLVNTAFVVFVFLFFDADLSSSFQYFPGICILPDTHIAVQHTPKHRWNPVQVKQKTEATPNPCTNCSTRNVEMEWSRSNVAFRWFWTAGKYQWSLSLNVSMNGGPSVYRQLATRIDCDPH